MGTTDLEILRLAARENRILVSQDFSTMPSQFLAFTAIERSRCVLLIRDKLRIGLAVENLVLIRETWESAEGRTRYASCPGSTWCYLANGRLLETRPSVSIPPGGAHDLCSGSGPQTRNDSLPCILC